MTILCNRSLDCTEHWDSIVHEYGGNNESTMTYYKSVEKEHAEELEKLHIFQLHSDECIKEKSVNKTYPIFETNEVNTTCENGFYEQAIEVSYQLQVTDDNSCDDWTELETQYGKLINQTTEHKNFTIWLSLMENEGFVFEKNSGMTAQELCSSMCISLPYQSVGYAPNALDWYSPLRWWDMLTLIIAGVIQFRLKSIEDGDGYGSYGPLVVDEKDIAMTSVQILCIILTTAFYCVELTMSALWLTLHKGGHLEEEHTSYWTVYERNKMLTITNSIWIVFMVPMFAIAYKIKLQIQKYEQNQFLTEL